MRCAEAYLLNDGDNLGDVSFKPQHSHKTLIYRLYNYVTIIIYTKQYATYFAILSRLIYSLLSLLYDMLINIDEKCTIYISS